MFPAQIDINRPKDGYGVIIAIIDMQMNQAETDDKFELRAAGRQHAQHRSVGRLQHAPERSDDPQARR